VAFLFAWFPLYWMISTSLKPDGQWLTTPPVWIPETLTLDNYYFLFGVIDPAGSGWAVDIPAYMPALINSIVISVVASALSVAIGTMAAWAISRFRVGGDPLAIGFITPYMFPPMVVVLPMLIMYTQLNLVDTRIGLIILYIGFTLPFSVWMTKSFIDEIPKEFEETGMIVGLTRAQTFYKVTVPLIKSGLGSTFLFVFILNWSEFLMALSLSRSMNTTPVFLEHLFTTVGGELYGPQAAVGTISVLPMIVIGYLIYENLARGFTFGTINE